MTQTKPTWDAGRFLQTLTFFDAVPVLSWLCQLFRSTPQTQPPPQTATATGGNVVLVVGATGGVGKRVVRKLQERGYPVRALVRDLQRGRELLGAGVDLIDADLTLPGTLTPAVTQDIRAVICCVGPRVQPVEGDTPDRAKYYQGIKFYLPEVVGDTPEAIDYQGIRNLLAAIGGGVVGEKHSGLTIWIPTLTDEPNASPLQWGALDDVVMGGVSSSAFQVQDGVGLFSGTVSTANSGGFTSVRTRNLNPPLDLSAYEGIRLRVRGDGQRYKFFLRSSDGWDSTAYAYSFDTQADSWIEVAIPFKALVPVFRAKTIPDAPPLDTSAICSLQLMLSKFEYDRSLNPHFQPGPFRLEVGAISAYGGPGLPKFVLVSSAGVTRPGRPGLNLEEEPPAVRLNDQLGGILTWKLRGEEAVRASGIPYTIVRPCALTEEPGGKQLVFEQGDNIRGKVSREDVAELCIQALAQPGAVNVTFEVKATEETGTPDWKNLFKGLQADPLPE